MSGQGIPLDEPMIDTVGDYGIILANGAELTYTDLSRILLELGNENLLRSTVIRDRFSAEHAARTLREAGRVFEVVARIKAALATGPAPLG